MMNGAAAAAAAVQAAGGGHVQHLQNPHQQITAAENGFGGEAGHHGTSVNGSLLNGNIDRKRKYLLMHEQINGEWVGCVRN